MAIGELLAGAARSQAAFDVAAGQIAKAGLPMVTPTRTPAPPGPASTPRAPEVDVAEQLTMMMVAAGVHRATLAALRSAQAAYLSTVDLARR